MKLPTKNKEEGKTKITNFQTLKTYNTMKKAIFCTILFFSLLRVNAQSEEGKTIADETEAIETKTAYKVTSSNYFIPAAILEKYEEKVNSYNMKKRKDRHGIYKEYTFYFPVEMKEEIETFVSSLKRPEDKKAK